MKILLIILLISCVSNMLVSYSMEKNKDIQSLRNKLEEINQDESPDEYLRLFMCLAWKQKGSDMNDQGAYINELGGWELIVTYYDSNSSADQKKQAFEQLKALLI